MKALLRTEEEKGKVLIVKKGHISDLVHERESDEHGLGSSVFSSLTKLSVMNIIAGIGKDIMGSRNEPPDRNDRPE